MTGHCTGGRKLQMRWHVHPSKNNCLCSQLFLGFQIPVRPSATVNPSTYSKLHTRQIFCLQTFSVAALSSRSQPDLIGACRQPVAILNTDAENQWMERVGEEGDIMANWVTLRCCNTGMCVCNVISTGPVMGTL